VLGLRFISLATVRRALAGPLSLRVVSEKFHLHIGLEPFQQLLRPHSLSGGAAKAPALGSSIFSPPSTAANPAPGSSAEIPMGASYAPLNSGIGMPVGVTPLPGLLGQTNMGLPVFAPEWKPQAPPWSSSAPQLGAFPQRKF